MTTTQHCLFRDLNNDVLRETKMNTLKEHSRIAYEALIAGHVPEDEARKFVQESEQWLIQQGVEPVCIPWYTCK